MLPGEILNARQFIAAMLGRIGGCPQPKYVRAHSSWPDSIAYPGLTSAWRKDCLQVSCIPPCQTNRWQRSIIEDVANSDFVYQILSAQIVTCHVLASQMQCWRCQQQPTTYKGLSNALEAQCMRHDAGQTHVSFLVMSIVVLTQRTLHMMQQRADLCSRAKLPGAPLG
jgi:hypothetical protein